MSTQLPFIIAPDIQAAVQAQSAAGNTYPITFQFVPGNHQSPFGLLYGTTSPATWRRVSPTTWEVTTTHATHILAQLQATAARFGGIVSSHLVQGAPQQQTPPPAQQAGMSPFAWALLAGAGLYLITRGN